MITIDKPQVLNFMMIFYEFSNLNAFGYLLMPLDSTFIATYEVGNSPTSISCSWNLMVILGEWRWAFKIKI